MIVLPDAEDHSIIFSFTWTKHRNVTDRQTDGLTDSSCYYSGLHYQHSGRAVKKSTSSNWKEEKSNARNLIEHAFPLFLSIIDFCFCYFSSYIH